MNKRSCGVIMRGLQDIKVQRIQVIKANRQTTAYYFHTVGVPGGFRRVAAAQDWTFWGTALFAVVRLR